MNIDEIFNKNHDPSLDYMVNIINSECSQFIGESESFPLLKNLPSTYGDFHKVKVRIKKKQDDLSKIFNNAFHEAHSMIRESAVFSNGEMSFIPANNEKEPFFIFPINGYQYLYNSEVESLTEHNDVLNKLSTLLGDKNMVAETLIELLKFTYKNNNLIEGINSGAEILFFNIPYYYAIRSSSFGSYDKVLTLL